MEEHFDRKTTLALPDGRRVTVSTIGSPLGRETAVFAVNEADRVTSLMHLRKERHGPDVDLDAAHERIVAGIGSGEIAVYEEGEPTDEDVAEALLWIRALTEVVEGGPDIDDLELND